MAPIHHHFEMLAWTETKIIVRFWIVAAICGASGFVLYYLRLLASSGERRPLRWCRACAARASPPCEAIRRAWPGAEVVAAVDARPDVDTARLRGARRRTTASGRSWCPVHRADGAGARARACRGEAPQVAAARARGRSRLERGRAGRADAAANPIVGVTGTNGKTTTTAPARRDAARRRRSSARSPATSAGRSRSWPARGSAPTLDRLRAVELPARGHRHACAPGGGDPERHPRPPRPPRQRSRSTLRCKLRIFENQTAERHGGPERRRPGAARRRRCPAPARACGSRRRAADRIDWEHRPAARRAQPRERARPPPPARGPPASSGAAHRRARCASSTPRRTGSRRSPAAGASSG